MSWSLMSGSQREKNGNDRRDKRGTSPLSPLGIDSFRGEGLAALRGDATALFTLFFICISGIKATIVD